MYMYKWKMMAVGETFMLKDHCHLYAPQGVDMEADGSSSQMYETVLGLSHKYSLQSTIEGKHTKIWYKHN